MNSWKNNSNIGRNVIQKSTRQLVVRVTGPGRTPRSFSGVLVQKLSSYTANLYADFPIGYEHDRWSRGHFELYDGPLDHIEPKNKTKAMIMCSSDPEWREAAAKLVMNALAVTGAHLVLYKTKESPQEKTGILIGHLLLSQDKDGGWKVASGALPIITLVCNGEPIVIPSGRQH